MLRFVAFCLVFCCVADFVPCSAQGAKRFEPLRIIEADDGRLQWVAISTDDRHVASCGDRFVQMFDVETGKLVRRFAGHSEDIFRFVFSPNGKWVASGSRDKTVHVWDVENGNVATVLSGHSDRIIGVNFSADSRWLVSASANHDGTIRIWDCSTWQEYVSTKSAPNTNAMFVAFSPDGRTLAASEYRGGVRLYDFGQKTLTLRHQMTHDNGEMVPHVGFTPDGKSIVTSGWDRTARSWNVTTGQQEWKITAPPYARCYEASVYSPDRQILYLVTRDETIQARDATTQKLIRSRRWRDEVRGLAITSDGKMLATAGHAGKIKLWSSSDFEK